MRLRLASIVVATAILAGAYPSVQVHLAAQGKGASRTEPDSDLDGTLEVVYEDGYDGPRLKHFVRTASDRVELDFGGRRPRRLRTGSRIRARGTLRNGKLAVNPLDVAALGSDVAALGEGGGGEGSTQALVSPNTFGVQPTLVILFNFPDLVQQPYTTASASTITFTDVNNFDLENSFNQTSLSGTVVGWYTITSSAAQGCNYNTWATQAEAAATTAGVNLNLYPRRVFGFPQTSACNWWGLGTMGGGGTSATPSRAWINGIYNQRVVAHEMGHNFGLYHSQSRTCDTTNGCLVDEYGDDHDVMGGGPGGVTGHFNAYQKERLGWLNYGSSPTMTNVNGSGQYALEPYAKPWTGGAKALKIVRSTGTSNTYLYAEARTSFGIDTGLPAGIVIHTGNDTDGSQIFEEDVQPTDVAADFILDPGQSITFSDAVPPVTIQTLTATSTGATLQITQACMNSLGSSGQSFGDTGGPGTVALTTGTNCTWTATSDSPWLTVNGGSGSGTGSATINFTVAANAGTARTGTLTIAGQTFAVTQAANACLFTVTPLNPSVNHTAASYSVSVTATPISCSWTAVSNDPLWLTITAGASGTGNGTVTYAVTSNAASHIGRTGTISVPGQTVTVFQEGLAGQLISPSNGATNVKTTNVTMLWTGQTGVQSYRLTVGTTVGAADVYDSGETTATNKTVPSMPASRLLFARLRTTWPDAATPKQDITFTTVDRISGLQVLGSQTPTPIVAGGSAQYGASAANSVKVSFTGSLGTCTATFGTTGLPAGATATFAPTSATSSATDQFTLLSVATTAAVAPGTYPFNVTAQESAPCASAPTTLSAAASLVVFGSTSLATASATGTHGGSAAVSATLTSSGTPLPGKTLSFTLNGIAVGSATTSGSGVATIASASLAGVNAGSFPSGVAASFAGDVNYGASSANNSLTVSQKSVTPSVTAGNKAYDGTAAAAVSCTLTGVVGGDVVTCSGTGSFDTPAVGTDKTVTASGLSLSGAAAGNYALSTTTATTSASITAIELTPSITVASKIYDGTIAANMACTVTGVINGDEVTCDGVALFDSAIVGTGKPVTTIELALQGPQADNYVLSTTTATATADITSVALTAAATVASRLYNGTTTASLTSCTLTGVVTDDIVTCSGTATFTTASIGTGKPVTITSLTLGGPSAQNYYLTSTTTAATASILALNVTPAITVANKTYDRTTAATLTSCTLAAQAGVANAIAVVWDANPVGDAIAGYWVLVGTAPGDYQQLFDAGPHPYFFYPNPVPGQQYFFAVSAYNDTGMSPLTEISGSSAQATSPSGDGAACAGTPAFNTAGTGPSNTVTASGLTLTGTASTNYTLTTTSAITTAAISAATVTPAITAANKIHDGTSSATITCTLTGVIGGDVVTCSGTGSFDSSAVGTGKTVTSSNLALSGAAAGNYALSTTTATTTANITAATSPSVTVSPDPAAVNATLTATVANGPASATDWVGLYLETALDNAPINWCYLNGTTTAPATGVTNATVSCFTAPASGRYQVRLFTNNTVTKVATSNTITVPTPPALTIGDVSATEGHAGTKTFGFTVSLSAATTLPVTVQYATANGSATAGSDYAAASGTLTFAAGVTAQTISISVMGDTAVESNETFSITLSQPTNATIADSEGLGTILNDDAAAAGAAIVLTPDPATVGGTLTATLSNTPGSATDWVGLYAETALDNTYVDWCYLNGAKTAPATGMTNATVTCFTAPASGRYQVRLFANNTVTKIATSNTITVSGSSGPSGPSVALSPSAPAVGATLSAAVSGGAGNRTDWVGLYLETALDNAPVDWCYLNGTKTAPAVGLSTATVTCFTAPASGRYQVRLFINDTVTKVATSNTITVSGTSGLGGPSVALSPTSPAIGATLSAAVSGGAGNRTDWVGLYQETALDNAPINWCYLNGTKTAPAVGLSTATVTCFTAPASGRYQVRLFINDTVTKVATSNTITVPGTSGLSGPSVALSPTSPAVGATLSAAVSGGPANATDWVGLYQETALDNSFVDWCYLNSSKTAPSTGVATATVTCFTAPASGRYQVRLFTNNTVTKVATSNTITVP